MYYEYYFYAGYPVGHSSGHAVTKSHHFIESSGENNECMKMHVLKLAEKGPRHIGKRLYWAKIAVMSHAYKKNSNDRRESLAIKIIEKLANIWAGMWVYDPSAPSLVTKAAGCLPKR